MSSIFIQPIDEILTKLCWCYKCQIKWCHGVSSCDSNPSRNLWGYHCSSGGIGRSLLRKTQFPTMMVRTQIVIAFSEQRVAKHSYAWALICQSKELQSTCMPGRREILVSMELIFRPSTTPPRQSFRHVTKYKTDNMRQLNSKAFFCYKIQNR